MRSDRLHSAIGRQRAEHQRRATASTDFWVGGAKIIVQGQYRGGIAGSARHIDPVDILVNCAPRQQMRLLEHGSGRSVVRAPDLAPVICFEAKDQPQRRGLATAGGADETGKAALSNRS